MGRCQSLLFQPPAQDEAKGQQDDKYDEQDDVPVSETQWSILS